MSRHAQERKTVKTDWPRKLIPAACASLTAVRENVPVMLLTGVAFGASYGHIAKLCGDFGPHGWVQYATAGCVDLLCIIGAEERQRDKRIGRPRTGFVTWPTIVLFVGIAVTLAANAATAERQFLGYCVAAWPAGALLLAVSILERRASFEVPRQQAESALRTELDAEREARLAAEDERETERETHQAELATAREALAGATAKAEALAQQLAAATAARGGSGDRKRAGSGSGNGDAGTGSRRRKPEPEIEDAPEDLDSELKVLWYLDRGLNASQAGKKAGLTDSRGRQIARLRGPAPDGLDKGAS